MAQTLLGGAQSCRPSKGSAWLMPFGMAGPGLQHSAGPSGEMRGLDEVANRTVELPGSC